MRSLKPISWAFVALTLFFAFSGPLRAADCPSCPCQDCKCDAGKPCPVFLANAQKSVFDTAEKALLDAPFDTIVFAVYPDGKVEFVRLVAQEPVEEVNVTVSIADAWKEEGRPDLFVNGKKVTDAELNEWQQRTTGAKVRIFEDRMEFYGGKPAYQAASSYAPPVPLGYPQPTLGGCPNGGCPNGVCPPAPQRRR